MRAYLSRDRSVLTHRGSGRPIIVFVGCEPLPRAAIVAIARVWWSERDSAARHGVGGIAPRSGDAPHYKYKVSSGTAGGRVLRLTATTPNGEKTVPAAKTAGMRILEGNPSQCAAAARALVQRTVDLHGSNRSEESGPSAAQLNVLTETFRAGHPPDRSSS